MPKPALPIIIETHRPDGSTDSVKSIDWNNSSDRKWLVNHMHWALNNEHSLLVARESDDFHL